MEEFAVQQSMIRWPQTLYRYKKTAFTPKASPMSANNPASRRGWFYNRSHAAKYPAAPQANISSLHLAALLDKVIASLMVAIVLTLAWPVSQAFRAQTPASISSFCLQARHSRTKVKLLSLKS